MSDKTVGWKVEPLEGLGPLKFGMSASDIRAIIGKDPWLDKEAWRLNDSYLERRWCTWDLGFGLNCYFDGKERLIELRISGECGRSIALQFEGLVLFSAHMKDLGSRLQSMDPLMVRTDRGFKSKQLGISIDSGSSPIYEAQRKPAGWNEDSDPRASSVWLQSPILIEHNQPLLEKIKQESAKELSAPKPTRTIRGESPRLPSRWDVVPFKRVGGLYFGISREETLARMPPPTEQLTYGQQLVGCVPETPMDLWLEPLDWDGIAVGEFRVECYYTEDLSRLTDIAITYEPCHYEWFDFRYDGISLLEYDAGQLYRQFEAKGLMLSQEFTGFIAPDVGIWIIRRYFDYDLRPREELPVNWNRFEDFYPEGILFSSRETVPFVR